MNITNVSGGLKSGDGLFGIRCKTPFWLNIGMPTIELCHRRALAMDLVVLSGLIALGSPLALLNRKLCK